MSDVRVQGRSAGAGSIHRNLPIARDRGGLFGGATANEHRRRAAGLAFAEIDHGTWLTAFGIHRRSVRWVLGNPLIAVTTIRYDSAGLFTPVELLITEHEDGGGTNIVYIRPSSLILVEENEPLRQTAEILDTKLAALVTSATGQVGEVDGSQMPRS